MTDIGRVGFIGAGVMASALIEGILKSGLLSPEGIIASDRSGASREKLVAKGVGFAKSNTEVAIFSDIVIIAVKPDVVSTVVKEIVSGMDKHELRSKTIISIAAGVTISTIEGLLPDGVPVIRVMPNTPCLVGECAAAYAVGTAARPSDKFDCEAIFGSVGKISEVPEKLMDAVTGLSGSGPAYVFMFIEALADGAVRMGIPRPIALKLAAQTVKGAAAMCLETGSHPGVLKDQVCSPGGTTIAGVEALEEHAFRAAAMSAVTAATARSKELRELSEQAKK